MKNLKPGMLTYKQDETDQPKRIFGFTSETLIITPVEEDKTSPDPEWINTSPTWEIKGEMTINKKDAERLRKLFSLLKKKSRLPRKLKKAYRHMALTNDHPKIDRNALKDSSIKLTCDNGPESYIRIKSGYHRTKWVNKAIFHFKKAHQAWWNYYKKKFENAINNSNREYIVTKEEQKKLADIINRK